MSYRPAAVRGREAFRALVRSPRRAKSGPVTVHFVASDGVGAGIRVAYSIGRKVGGAVVRNQWRRRLRAIVAEAAPRLPPGDYLVGVTPDVHGLSFGELRERVIETMKRASGER